METSVAKYSVDHKPGHRRSARKAALVSAKAAAGIARSGAYVVDWVVDKKNNKADTVGLKASSKIVFQRLRDTEGKLVLHRFVDVRSASFGADFDKVFRSNVRKARRENKRIVGSTDHGRGKG